MESRYDSLALKAQLCFPIYLCSKEIIREYTPLLKQLNLTYTQYIVMSYFWELRKSNVKEIAETLLIDPSTLTPLLKKLEQKGYINRTRSIEDERNLDIVVTEKGLNLRDQALTIPSQINKRINLSTKETLILYKLMYKVLQNIHND